MRSHGLSGLPASATASSAQRGLSTPRRARSLEVHLRRPHDHAATLILTGAICDCSLSPSRSHAGTGALIGGAVLGIGLGVLAQGVSQEEGCNEPRYGRGCGPAPFFEGLLIGGTAGALIGALIGAPFPKWQLRVP